MYRLGIHTLVSWSRTTLEFLSNAHKNPGWESNPLGPVITGGSPFAFPAKLSINNL